MINEKKRVVFLYSELADYFVSAVNILSVHVNVTVIHWPVNTEAPFNLDDKGNLFKQKSSFSTAEEMLAFVQSEKPNLIVVSGWMDKDYLLIARNFKGKIPTVVSMDNHWVGSLRQWGARLMSSVKIHRYFSDIWVPGIPQKKYAQKLGFKPNRIKTGFYAANTSIYLTRNTLKKRSQLRVYPRVLFYLGRYVEHKGIFDLWNAFDNYKSNGGKWELWCAGTGELWDKRPNIQGLKHLGFVQPTDIPSLTINVGAYILPSHKEPWGVAVQEMASAGLPLLLSTQIGSKDQFLAVGENGYEFPPEDHSSIENLLKKLDELNDLELLQMGQSSVDKADSIKQTDWVQTVLNWL